MYKNLNNTFNEKLNSQNNYDPTNTNNNTHTNKEPVRIKIENVLFEYVHLTQPYAFSQNEKPKFSVTLLILKPNKQYDNDINQHYAEILQKVRDSISEAYNIATQTIWKNITQIPDLQKLESKILRDGNKNNNSNYHGSYYIKASRNTTRLVTAIDNNNQVIQDKQQTLQYLSQIQNGDWGNAYFAIKGYSINNYQGIGIYLDAVQKTHNKAANYNSTAINTHSFNPSDYL